VIFFKADFYTCGDRCKKEKKREKWGMGWGYGNGLNLDCTNHYTVSQNLSNYTLQIGETRARCSGISL
jgi:hypothetical protein